MDWSKEIDQYCERTGPEFNSEPLNAVTNLSFVVAAVLLWRLARKTLGRKFSLDLKSFVAMVFVVGVGSALFHTYATFWAMLADVIPIGITLLLYLAIFMRRVAGYSWLQTLAGLFTFGALCGAFTLLLPKEIFHGSSAYFGCIVALIVMGHFVAKRRGDSGAARLLYGASAVFALSLTFRTIDPSVCDHLHIGTHFLWHLLNGVCLYLAGRALFGLFKN